MRPQPTDPLDHIRSDVMAQPEAERLDYLMDLFAYYFAPVPAFFEGCARLGLHLAPTEARILFALDQRRGRFVSLDGLLAARCLDRAPDDWSTHDQVSRDLHRIRAALTRARLPVAIENHRGLGYVLTAPLGFRFEDAAKAQASAQ